MHGKALTWSHFNKLSLDSLSQGDFLNQSSSPAGRIIPHKAPSHGKAAPAAVGREPFNLPGAPRAVGDSGETRAEVSELFKGKPPMGRAGKRRFSGLF